MRFDAKHLLPQKWSVACWTIFVIWLAFAFWVNFPFVITGAAANDPSSEIYELLGEYGTVSTRSGWPFSYMECTNAKTKKEHWLNFFPMFGIFNLLLVLATQAFIVAVMQTWARRFSLSSLFTAIGIVSVLLVLGRLIFSTSNNYLVAFVVFAIYFVPVWLGALLLARHRLNHGNRGIT